MSLSIVPKIINNVHLLKKLIEIQRAKEEELQAIFDGGVEGTILILSLIPQTKSISAMLKVMKPYLKATFKAIIKGEDAKTIRRELQGQYNTFIDSHLAKLLEADRVEHAKRAFGSGMIF